MRKKEENLSTTDVAHGELLLRVCVVCGNEYLGQRAVGRWGSIGKSST